MNEFPSEELAEALYETLVRESVDCKDPYDLYVNRIKASVFGNPKEISTRIDMGYHLILNQLAQSN